MDSNVQTYKARLVIKGYRKDKQVDFVETLLPITMLKSIRILFAITAYYDYNNWQMDVKIEFLNDNLQEDIYVT